MKIKGNQKPDRPYKINSLEIEKVNSLGPDLGGGNLAVTRYWCNTALKELQTNYATDTVPIDSARFPWGFSFHSTVKLRYWYNTTSQVLQTPRATDTIR